MVITSFYFSINHINSKKILARLGLTVNLIFKIVLNKESPSGEATICKRFSLLAVKVYAWEYLENLGGI